MKKNLSVAAFMLAASMSSCRSASPHEPASMLELRSAGCVRQMGEYSCGAAALATLMNMFGDPVTEQQILESIYSRESLVRKVDEKESTVVLRALNLEDLETASRERGFKALSLQADSGEAAVQAIQTLQPAIARLSLHKEYLHFVVIRAIQNEWVSISDPAYGNFKIPLKQFYANWQAGERYIFTIGKKPFLAYEKQETGEMFVKRDEGDAPPADADISPRNLYRSAMDAASRINSLPR